MKEYIIKDQEYIVNKSSMKDVLPVVEVGYMRIIFHFP